MRVLNLQLASKVDFTVVLLLTCIPSCFHFCQANTLSESTCGKKILPYHHTPTRYNEVELFGVSYLYKQCDQMLELSVDNLSANEKGDEVDEGFIDDGDTAEAAALSEDPGTVDMGVAEEEEEPEPEPDEQMEDEEAVCTSS